MIQLIHGDCIVEMRKIPEGSIDLVLTDPPYGLSFMGKKWDYDVPTVEIWQECLRVLKPGGHLLAFAGTRTQHRMAVRIEDAGFEIRDMIAWVYGSGFPKSLNIGKAVDKLQGKEVKSSYNPNYKNNDYGKGFGGGVTDNTPADNEWNGWGTALKPALEPITVARKPLSEKTVTENVLKYGTGGLNIDQCRVGNEERTNRGMSSLGVMHDDNWKPQEVESTVNGRFPANLIHDGSEEVVGLFPYTKSGKAVVGTGKGYAENPSSYSSTGKIASCYAYEGSSARFFYCAKASKKDRGEGNIHATVKPTKLMEYLVTLASREGATILDPFMGSGTTGIACKKHNRNFIGIELDKEYFDIATHRINCEQPPLLSDTDGS